MKRQEFEAWASGVNLGEWKVELERDTLAPHTFGCHVNDRGEFVVYVNDAYRHKVKLITLAEDEAFDELKSNIEEVI